MLLATIALFACNNKSQAQTTVQLVSSDSLETTAHVVNSTTEYFVLPSSSALKVFPKGIYKVGFLATKVSGTATLQCVLEGSIDGTNYFKMHKVRGTIGGYCDTFATGTFTTPVYGDWTVRPGEGQYTTPSTYSSPVGGVEYSSASRVKYVRVRFVPSGTQEVIISDVKISGE